MSSTPPVLRSIDQLLGLADGGDYLPDLLDRIEANNIEMRQHAQDYATAATSSIPVFEEGAFYRLAVRFKYRKSGDSVKFIVSLYNADVALRDAAREAIETARAATDLPVLMGTPES